MIELRVRRCLRKPESKQPDPSASQKEQIDSDNLRQWIVGNLTTFAATLNIHTEKADFSQFSTCLWEQSELEPCDYCHTSFLNAVEGVWI